MYRLFVHSLTKRLLRKEEKNFIFLSPSLTGERDQGEVIKPINGKRKKVK